MLSLTDGIGNITSYLYNNIIIDKDQQRVSGVILGNCIFGVEGKIVGKIVNNMLYNIKGEIVAQRIRLGQKLIIQNITDLYRQAWTITAKVKNHIAPWIEPTANWSHVTLPETLKKQ